MLQTSAGINAMHKKASQMQTRSLDNIVENPDSWRFHDKINSNVLFITDGSTSFVKEASSSNNNNNQGEAIEM